MPREEAGLRALSQAGFNLVRCRDKGDLDRAGKAGLKGWIPLPLQLGPNDERLRRLVDSVKEHPALAVWEGPDEIVWNFTAYSGLFRNGIYPAPDEWWRQTPRAIEYSERQAAQIMPKLRAAIQWLRSYDAGRRPVWINEAARSDLKFIREYVDSIQVTGCDIYPIHAHRREPLAVADYTERYKRVGKGLPVWMVLQGFAWGELAGVREPVAYPSFAETRMMAWLAIVHGARGILYWGMDAAPPQPQFRQSLHAMASELAALQPMLTGPEARGVRVEVIDSEGFDKAGRGVGWTCRRVDGDWLVALVNEDDRPHMGVVVSGLEGVDRLELLYGTETATVRGGVFVTRLMPHEVKLFATGRKWESARRVGRDYAGQ
ncbi:MAG: hypothetical protein ACP5U2_11955 [Bryobacteraceae bacterium]